MHDRIKKSNYDRLEFIMKEGQTYLAPAGGDREPKVNGIRRWEQAFRVYAAIYSKANPHRAAEIWHYIHVINTAASNYIWENVAYYDFTFCQMMAKNPHRSWAKLFGQVWNLAMCNPIDRDRNRQNYQGGSGNVTNKQKSHSSKQPCWKFNKNIPCDPNCDFDHKCSYCGSYMHSMLNCHKLHGKKNHNNQSKTSYGSGGSGNSNNNNNNNNVGNKTYTKN